MAKIVKEKLTIVYEMSIDSETGEILETKIVDKVIGNKTNIKVESSDNSDPTLTLDSSKCYFNPAAVSLMEINPDDRIDIKYEKGLPVIGKDEAFGTHNGNRVTKAFTIAYRGVKNEELAKHGNEFKVIPHPNKPGLFILDSGNKPIEELNGDENVSIEEDDILDGLVDDEDTKITEIDSNFFKL